MAFSVTYDPKDDLVFVTMKGVLRLPEIDSLAEAIAKAVAEHQCYRVLNDAREAQPDVSVLSIHSLPERFVRIMEEYGLKMHLLHRAIVVSAPGGEFRFFETVSRNRSQNLRLFSDIEEAKAWLLTYA